MQPRVLVVEDSPVIQRLIEMCLNKTNRALEFCGHGEEGLTKATTDPPDAMVLDIGLPGMGGWEVLTKLRANDSTAELPVLVLTAHAREDVRAKAAEHGASATIAKPFNPTDFRKVVLDLLALNHDGAVA